MLTPNKNPKIPPTVEEPVILLEREGLVVVNVMFVMVQEQQYPKRDPTLL